MLNLVSSVVPENKKKMDGVHENGRKWIAIGNLLDSGDLKMTNLTISVTSTQLDAKDSFKM